MRTLLTVMLLAVLGWQPLAAESRDVYPLATESERERFRTLTNELRCPKCQNQNIADSDAPIASDMRAEVHRMMQEGAGDEEIVSALVSRFGEFVRYKPEFDARTALLWATPVIVIVIGLVVIAVVVIRSRRHQDADTVLTEEQRRRADSILRRDS